MIIDGWLQTARKIKSPHFNDRPEENDVSLIVIHNISLPPAQFNGCYVEDFFQGNLDQSVHPFFQEIGSLRVSSHFYIRRNGAVIQFVPVNKRAWHAGVSQYKDRSNCNDFSIGIELEGTDDIVYTENQYRELIKLIRILCQCYPSLSTERIVGHCDVAPVRKTDPGASFEWKRLFKSLADD